MGSTMLARDVANGRLGFLFSRPLSWRTIWGGKWLAALVLVFSSGLLAAIPWMAAFPPGVPRRAPRRLLASGDARRTGCRPPGRLVVLVVGLANFGATAFRSRSPWLALDLVLLLAAMWATRRYVAPLLLYGVLAKEQVSSHGAPPAPGPRSAPRQRRPGRRRPNRPAPGARSDVARLLGAGRPHPGHSGGLLAVGPVRRPRRRERAHADQRSRRALRSTSRARRAAAGGIPTAS